jgi:cysteine desulfuration protein SufE
MSPELSTEEKLDNLPPALREIVDDFRDVEPAERLEYLLDFAMVMPDLPERLQSHRDEMDQVHENGAVHFYIDVPRESPTVRGYAAIIAEGLDGASPDEVLQTPEDVHYLLGLQEAISHQRLRGLHALMGYLKRQVVSKMGEQ